MHFQIFYALCSLAGQIGLRHTTFAHLKVRTGLFHERFLCAFLLIRSVLRAPVLHPQPSYPRAGTSIARCQTWGSRTDLGLKAVGKRPGPDAQNGRWLFLPPSPPRAGQATCGQRKRRRVMSSTGSESRVPMHSRSTAIAHHATLAPAARQRPRARSLSLQSSRPAGPSALATRQLPGSTLRIGARHPFSTSLAIHALAARLPRATGSRFGMNSGAMQRADELATTLYTDPQFPSSFLSFSAPFRSWLAPAPGKPVSTQ